VIGVGGLRHLGSKVGFSDLGPEITISAPGGNCVNLTGDCLYPLLTTTNAGVTTPVPSSEAYTDATNATIGTSFSAPLVAGTAALMLAVGPGLSPDEIRSLLRRSSRPFPTSGDSASVPTCQAPQVDSTGEPIDQFECYCTTSTCGAGMLDAGAAVALSKADDDKDGGGGALGLGWLLALGVAIRAVAATRRPQA
jgi:serine protease